MPELQISAWDLGILIGYVVLTRIGFGWFFARQTKGEGAEGYFCLLYTSPSPRDL